MTLQHEIFVNNTVMRKLMLQTVVFMEMGTKHYMIQQLQYMDRKHRFVC